MSEFFNFNLLGLIGAITGGLALYISYKNYKKQKPDLEVEVTNCQHDFPKPAGKPIIKDINFWVRFQVKNKGDRGTKIVNILLSFVVEGKRYQIYETNLLSDMWDITKDIVQLGNPQNRWIGAHDTIDITSNFNSSFDGTEENQIDCAFTICDTHKEYTAEAVSKKVERPPIEPKPLTK